MTISYGPLTWATSFEELTDPSVNYFWQGSFPVELDDMGIPVDENGMQCLPIDSILHPACRPRTIEEFIDAAGELYTLVIPDIDWCQKWFDDNYLSITPRTLQKYIISWALRHNNPLVIRTIVNRVRPSKEWWRENLLRSQLAKNDSES